MKKIFFLMAFTLVICGCQAEQKNDNIVEENVEQKTVEKTYVDHGMPVSNGPQSEPELMKGPDTPPPQITNEPKVITTDEKIRLTLPVKTE